jgi:aspartokinase
MITVADAIKEILNKTDFAEESLQNGVLNISAFARIIHPKVEELTKKEVSIASINMSLVRYAKTIQKHTIEKKDLQIFNIITRGALVEYCYTKSNDTLDALSALQRSNVAVRSQFFTSTVGITELAIVTEATIQDKIAAYFTPLEPKIVITDLASLTLQVGIDTIDLPGQSLAVIKELARHDISIVEYVTSPTELNIIVRAKDIQNAYMLLHHKFINT